MKKRPSATTKSHAIGWRAVFGFADAGGDDFSQARAAQICAIQQFTLTRLIGELLAATVLVLILARSVSLPTLGGWFAVALATSIVTVFNRVRMRDWHDEKASIGDLHRETLQSIALGIVWAAPPLLFGGAGGIEQQLGLWTVSFALMAGTALLLSPLPLGTISFLALVGGANAVMMVKLGMPTMGLAGAALTFMLIASAVANGRAFIAHTTAEFALAEKDEVVSLLLREFEDGDADWLWQIDASKSLTHVSPRLAYALGQETMQLEGRPFLQMLAGDSWESGNFTAPLRTFAEKLKLREAFSDLIMPVTIKGETRWWELSASPRFDDRGSFLGFRGVGSDVTIERHSADKINRMARFDTLTGLPNRLQVTEALAEAMADTEKWRTRCAFMMIDLDRFKAVNDTLGHPVGDRLLSRVSERLLSLMSDNEMCGRLGGDEFAVVVRDATDSGKLERLARRIIEELSRPYEVDTQTLYIGASVGTAIGPRDGRSVEMLIRSADLALYRSKDAGGGTYHAYEPQLHVHAEERRVLEIALRKALERGELYLHYQPVVSADSGGVEGFEALLRWTNPDLGNVSPAKFIPVAEDARLIAPIGEWVLRTACAEAMNWPSTVRIAVNVSADQLTDPSFTTTVISALANSGLPAHRLEIEVTESVFMREGTTAVNVLSQLLDMGIRLSLDDFGTGYSSLGYLSRTRFSTIKVDRSFVQGASRNLPESLAIIRAVVALAESLGMATTAEGVETEEEYAMIRKLGCTKVQGYLFGRPMATEDARALFTDASRTAA